jgi:hypothetical protein
MRSTIRLALILMIAAVAQGCGGQDRDATSSDAPERAAEGSEPQSSDEAGPFLVYRVLGGLASNQEAVLTIYGDRRGSYEVGVTDPEGGRRTKIQFRLTPAEYSRLREAVNEVDFAELPSVINARPGREVIDGGKLEVTHQGYTVLAEATVDSVFQPISRVLNAIVMRHVVRAGRLPG